MDNLFSALLAASIAGGGGTTNYDDLTNKPSINSVELSGNKSLSDIGIQSEIDSSHKLSADLVIDGTTNKFNMQADWDQSDSTSGDFIKNKPTLGTAAAKNATDTYNATGTDVTTGKAVAAALATLPEPMVFKGSLGADGTITTLPTASSSNKGYVYKVITAGTYASQSAKIGDTFVSDGSAWVLIPSGDEPSGTVTNVAVANGGGLTVSGSPITSSGTITVGHSNSVTAKTNSSVKKFTYDEHGHVTGSSELSAAESDALASGVDSTKVAQIATNKNNISYNTKNGVSNVLPLNTVYKRGIRADVTEPSKIHFYGTPDSSGTLSGLTKRMTLKEGTYTITVNTDFDTSINADIYLYDTTSSDTILTLDTSGTYEFTANPAHEYLYAFYFNLGVTVDFNYQVTVRLKNSPDVGFQSYALSNAELTAENKINKNNIIKDEAALVELVDGGAKNKLPITVSSQVVGEAVFTVNADNSISVYTTATTTVLRLITLVQATDNLYVSSTDIVSGVPSTDKNVVIQFGIGTSGNVKNLEPSMGYIAVGVSGYMRYMQIIIRSGVTISQTEPLIFRPMICSKAAWDISQGYAQYALPNPELTASVIETIDNGPKNKLSIGTPTSVPTGLTCVRNDDGTYTVSGTLTAANSISFNIDAISGDLVLSGCPEGGGDATYLLRITKSGSQVAGSVDTGNGSDVFVMDGTGYALNIRFAAGTYSDVVFSPMICSDVAWTISQAYQPYRPSYQELYEMVLALQGGN